MLLSITLLSLKFFDKCLRGGRVKIKKVGNRYIEKKQIDWLKVSERVSFIAILLILGIVVISSFLM